jgi:hypothetical protein
VNELEQLFFTGVGWSLEYLQCFLI